MLARVAGNMYWLTRYLERVESTVRVLNIHNNLLMDLPHVNSSSAWMPLVSIGGLDDEFSRQFDEPSEANVTYFLIADERNPGSIVNSLAAARENLRTTRDSMNQSLYEAINNLCLLVQREATRGVGPGQRQVFLNTVEHELLAITGAMEGSMSHDVSYLFLRMGRYLERADMTSRLLDVRSANLLPGGNDSHLLPFENRQWVSVLRSVSAFQMYLVHVRKPVGGPEVLAFLLQDRQLPRAYQSCLISLAQCLQRLDGNHTPMRRLRRLQREVDQADIVSLANDKRQMHDFIDLLQIRLARVGDGITERYFPPRTT
jgi:uncharacterized alpha-E superfamily protein